MAIPSDQLDTAALQRLERDFYREALLGNIDWTGSGGGTAAVEEAPQDGESYARKDGDWEALPSQISSGGWGNYINGDLTPISVPAATPTKLTMDTTNGTVVEDFLPLGVSTLWDNVNSEFNFSELGLGDVVVIRLDGSLTTLTNNTDYVANFVGAAGSAGEFRLPFSTGTSIQTTTDILSRTNEVYMGSLDTINNPAYFESTADKAVEVYIVDIYIRVIKQGQ